MRNLAGLLVVWSVAWSVAPGRISVDTKNDLYVDPWGFMDRALHLWDPQVTWGGLQNQAFGYLFPMGPFFGIGSELMPVWVVQRLWWMVLLTAGYLAMIGLLRAMGVGGALVRVVGALAYVLAPRVISTLGGLSSEAQPQLLAPAILLPLVLVDRSRLGVRKGAALSAGAVLCCGGVNATATIFAVLPAAIWLLTRRTWWRSPLTWVWGVLVLAATSWWLIPLLVLGGYSPPFLDWIENAQTVTAQIGLLDVLRGTTHWLGHLVTPGGVWWPAGFELVSSPAAIVLTTAVMTLGLAGFTLQRLPHRTFLVVCLSLGILFIALPHQGPLASPLTGHVQAVLDGPLAPLRNVHKADPLIRLPLAVGLAHLLSCLSTWRPTRSWLRGTVLGAVALMVVTAASPGFSGAISPRGSFVSMAPQWGDLGRWLDDRSDGAVLIVPASGFGEYVWGRTMDEPLRPLTTAAYAVRDAVPLAPAGTIRLLDEVETRLQTGRSIGGATAVLRSAGVRYVVLRNDLAAGEAGQPPVALARSAIRNTPDAAFARGFGKSSLDMTRNRVYPIEVYALSGPIDDGLRLWDADDVLGATGASEDLARLADAGLGGRPVIFDGDLTGALLPESHVVTDGFRARDRWFGAPRGEDVTSGLGARAAAESSDYFPWPEVERRSLVDYDGLRDVLASSSVAEQFGVVGLRPAMRPFAALDGNARTAWVTALDPRPELTIELPGPTDVPQVTLQPYADRARFGQGLGIATDVRVTTDRGVVDARLPASGRPTSISLPKGTTRRVRILIRDTSGGTPSEVVTGLSEVSIPGVAPVEVVRTPQPRSDTSDTAVLQSGLPGRDGCALLIRQFTCFAGLLVDPELTGRMVRDVSGLAPGDRALSGTLAVDPLNVPEGLLAIPGVEVTASSVRGYAPAGRPEAVADTDPRTAWSPSSDDSNPSVTISLDRSTTVEGIRIQARHDWALKEAPAVVVDVDGREFTRRLPEHGVVTIPPTAGRRITLTFVRVPGEGRPGFGALELEEVEFLGQPFARPAQELSAPCGEGPHVTVGGAQVQTRAAGPRSALFGVGNFTWSACAPTRVVTAESHRVTVDPWRDLVPAQTVVAPAEPVASVSKAVGSALTHERVTPTLVRAEIPSGPQRLLVMADNANHGWQATLGDTRLDPQVVDGRRQGFVVPAGLSGKVEIAFTPDVPFRWGLGLGAALAAVVTALALWPDQGRVRPRTSERRSRRRSLVPFLVPGFCAVVAGPVGFVLGAAAVAVNRMRRLVRPVRVGLVLGLGGAAAVVQAWLAPGSVGRSGVEATVRLLVLAAFAVALASQEAPDED